MDKIKFFDGGMGTMLQAAGLKAGQLPETLNITNKDMILAVHRAYADAGCEYITANTFGANCLKFENYDEIIKAGIELAKSVGKKVLLDIGPTGKLLKPMGELAFDDAIDIFAKTVIAGKDGADAVLIETMSDTFPLRTTATCRLSLR